MVEKHEDVEMTDNNPKNQTSHSNYDYSGGKSTKNAFLDYFSHYKSTIQTDLDENRPKTDPIKELKKLDGEYSKCI